MFRMLTTNKRLKVMLVIILVLALTSGLVMTGCSPRSAQGVETQGTKVGNLAPSFQLQNVDGQTVSLSNLRQKPVLINFWATWCGYCIDEMPYIQEIYEEWSDKGLVVLGINMGENSSTVAAFMQNYNLSFIVLLDTKQDVAQRYNITGIPATFFIDKDGIIQATKIGAFRDKAEIETSLSKIIP